MPRQNTNSFSFEGIPDITVVIIITSKQDSTRGGECHGSDTAENIVVSVGIELSVGSEVE